MAGSLASLAPTAPAQGSPAAICFNNDRKLDDPDQRFRDDEIGACDGSTPPDYSQGSTIRVWVPGWAPGAEAGMSARCVAGCPAGDASATNVYWIKYRGGAARFPQDFLDPGPSNDGGNAVFDKAPRYNSTWEFTLHIATPVQRRLSVWLYDAYHDDLGNYTVRPGALHKVTATGFDPNAQVSVRWERRDPNTGRYLGFDSDFVRASAAGVAILDFQFNKGEVAEIATCGGLLADCYRIIISGAGKEPETVNVRMGPAYIMRSEVTSPKQATGPLPVFERSRNVTTDVDLYYPSGFLHTGPKFVTDDAPASVRHGGRALRVAIERVHQVNRTASIIDEVPLRYDASTFLWRAQWTVPKDIALDEGVFYQMRLLEQRDIYGNHVAQDWLVNFTIKKAQIFPRIEHPFPELQRTELGVVRLAVRYHNATPFTPDDAPEGNSSPLRGCFVRVPPPPPAPAPPNPDVPRCGPTDTLVWGKYYEGAWNFTVRYPRTYEHLEPHRFVLVNGTNDRWGNDIFATAGSAFSVVVARPTIEVSTVSRGEEAEVIERGNRVFISAAITYHDGSPYNHQVRVNPNSSAAQVLTGTLIRRGPGTASDPYGPIASEEPFNLTLSDASAGRWSAFLQLTDDDTFTPVGIWTWKFDVVDNTTVPNRNVTVFEREVVSSLIRVCPTFEPPSSVPTGAMVKFRFRLYYSECEVGREVPVGALEGKLNVRVYRYNPQNLSAIEPVSNVLIPSFARESAQDWGVEYQVANNLFSGSYVFVVTGVDTFGNRVVPNSRSRPFSTYTEVLLRTVLTQPQPVIERGDSATVVFDAREDDTGVDPLRPAPRIQLERFDTSSTTCATAAAEGGCWARERADVRVPDPTLEDHMGVFPIGVDTPVGLYRFSLQGRDRDYRIITAVSANFTVNPTQLTRALIQPPPERVVKGEPFTFYVESVPGDILRDRTVFLNGRPFIVPAPQITNERDRLNVTWSVPFEAPTGNYTLRLSGRDVNGNTILVLSPPIDALPASLEGRIIGQPPRTIARGNDVRLQFGVGYPDGSFYAAQDEPRVFVVSATGFSEATTIKREGLSFAAVWTPDEDAPIGEYYFEVSPQARGGTGNLFPPLRSQPFRVVPGAVARPAVDDLGLEVQRFAQAVYTVPFAADDRFVGFELVYYGPSLVIQIDTTAPMVEVTRTPLPHTIDASAGKYVARIVTDHQTQTGTFKVFMTGEDVHGNTITSVSRPFLIKPTTIAVSFDAMPPDAEFGEGKTITIGFVARYGVVGTIMDESYGKPSATVLFNGRPVTQRPDLEYRDGHWFMTWTAPEILPPGEYTFAVGGADIMGNPIATARSTPYTIAEGSIPESFMKTVPGPSSALLLALVAVAAALLARRRN